jgi:hypothetical protein
MYGTIVLLFFQSNYECLCVKCCFLSSVLLIKVIICPPSRYIFDYFYMNKIESHCLNHLIQETPCGDDILQPWHTKFWKQYCVACALFKFCWKICDTGTLEYTGFHFWRCSIESVNKNRILSHWLTYWLYSWHKYWSLDNQIFLL